MVESTRDGFGVVSVPFRGFYLLNHLRLMESTVYGEVSVPFRGFYLLNAVMIEINARDAKKFPSPSGVSIFSISINKYR